MGWVALDRGGQSSCVVGVDIHHDIVCFLPEYISLMAFNKKKGYIQGPWIEKPCGDFG